MPFTRLDEKHKRSIRKLISPDRFSDGESHCNLHARDQSFHPPCPPDAVVWPKTAEEVSQILAYANTHGIPIVGWGSGSSLEGNPIPVCGGVILDFSEMNQILDIREADFQVVVQPGLVYQDLNHALRHTGLFFPPDPGARATIGGMIANNASGTRTVYYGSTKDYVLRLKVVMANGDIVEIGGRSAKSSSGYNLNQLFIGSEGTLGIIVEATLRLTGTPEDFSAVIATFPSVESAGKAVFEIRRSGLSPAALELLGPECIELFNIQADLGLTVSPTLFIEFHGASKAYMAEMIDICRMICEENGSEQFEAGLGRQERDRLFEARHDLGEMIVRNHPGCAILVMDVAVPPSAYPEMIGFARREIAKSGLTGYVFSHAGDGNLHLNIAGETGNTDHWQVIDAMVLRIVNNALSLGGTATGEHGVGIGKRKFMEAEHGRSLELMKRIKNLFDPKGILNPGKIFPEDP